ncbi:hypothetical protein AC1031_019945 [Aphanomyces cochlioides]|nr:hypothetical protein AC1031_019945 [Aphanomyces cochlioides]
MRLTSLGTVVVALVASSAMSQTCSVERDVDYEGNDIKTTKRSDYTACCADCEKTIGCKVYNWDNGVCYLKSAQGRTVRLPGAVSGVLQPTTTAPPATCSTLRDVDYAGNDIATTERKDPGQCCADCQATKGCKLYNWADGVCYLKNAKGRSSRAPGTVSGFINATPKPTPSPTTTKPTPSPTTSQPTLAPTTAKVTPAPTSTPAPTPISTTVEPTLAPTTTQATTIAPTTLQPTLAPTPPPTPSSTTAEPTPVATTSQPTMSPTPPATTSAPTPAVTPATTSSEPTPVVTPAATTSEPTPVATTAQATTVAPTPAATTSEPTPEPTPVATTAKPTPVATTAQATTVAPTSVAPTPAPTSSTDDFYIHHDGYSLLFNCARRTADRWNYTLTTNKLNASRPSSFYVDPDVPKACQQFTTNSYASVKAGYDRGHLVASSMMTDSPEQRKQSHYMTNIAPQVSSFNQGIWENTEDLEACYRDLHRIYTWGGIIYTDKSNDYYLTSHGIRTPDFWWKVVWTKDDNGKDKIIAWYFPNQENLGKLDSYLVSVADIEAKLNDGQGPIPVPEELKSIKETTTWTLPAGCNRSR